VLRGGSNFTMQPPNLSAAENLMKESEGYAGLEVSLENIYLAGSVVLDELIANWDTYETQIPSMKKIKTE
jgi:purine nucleoside permease